MSVDTRTPQPRMGAAGRLPGFDDEPALSTVKVPCDPAQVIVNHASFRVRLARSPRVAKRFARPLPLPGNALDDTAQIPILAGSLIRRRAPVVWSGRSVPGDTAAGGLLQAVRRTGDTPTGDDGTRPM